MTDRGYCLGFYGENLFIDHQGILPNLDRVYESFIQAISMNVRMSGRTGIYVSGPVLRLSHTSGIGYMRLYSHWMVSGVTALSGVEVVHAKRSLAWVYFHSAITDR